MSRAQIAMHFVRHDFDYTKALSYLRLLGDMEHEARQFLQTLEQFVE